MKADNVIMCLGLISKSTFVIVSYCYHYLFLILILLSLLFIFITHIIFFF